MSRCCDTCFHDDYLRIVKSLCVGCHLRELKGEGKLPNWRAKR